MGITDTMGNAMDITRKIELNSEASLDALYEILSKDEKVLSFGTPKLKKGLFKCIEFPKNTRVTVRVTVKKNVVTVQKITDTSSSSISVGGFSMNLDKDMRGGNAFKTLDAGHEYFVNLAEAVKTALADK